MATQIIHFESDPECDGVKLFAYGTDTLAATGSVVTMGANDPTHGTCEVEDVAAGLYKVITYEGADPIGYQFVDLLLDDGEFFCRDSVADDVRNSSVIEAIPDVSGLALEATAQEIKSQTNKLDFGGTGGALKSEATNMRGTDNAITSLSGVATSTQVAAVGTKVDNLAVPSAEDNAIATWSFSGGRTLTSFGTLIAEIVSGVWGAASRTLTGFTHKVTVAANEDKFGYALQTAPPTKEAIAGQVRTELSAELGRLDQPVSSRLAPATAGRTIALNEDGSVNAEVSIEGDVFVAGFRTPALQQLAGTRIININVPTLRGSSLTDPLIRGDTYSAALGSAIEFARSDFPDLPEDATARLTARKTHGDTEASFSIDGSLVIHTGVKVVRFEATADESRLWEPGTYEFDVSITWPDGATRTFVGPRLTLQVIADISD